MFSETYPITKGWLRENDLNINADSIVSRQFSSLYIGKEASFHLHISLEYKNSSRVVDLGSARTLLEELLAEKKNMPDVILIDIPFSTKQYNEFCNFLRYKAQLSIIPVLYNKGKLTSEEVSCLKEKELVDDIIDLSAKEIDYSGKVAFLKKAKKFSAPLQLNKSQKKDVINNNHSSFGKKSKRIFDVFVSSVLIICCFPLFLLIALAIRLESRGPIFYTSLRAGKGFKIFPFYKFRTMEIDADKQIDTLDHLNKYGKSEKGAKFLKIYNDPRVTRVGRFLRKTSLDELPQLYNVLKGDMSLVGNRPLPIYEATTLTTNEFAERFMAPAGITGLWQIKKKNNPDMSAEERINLDISYARSYSFLKDIKIIAKTPAALFQRNNL